MIIGSSPVYAGGKLLAAYSVQRDGSRRQVLKLLHHLV
jgi:hypothetical protein